MRTVQNDWNSVIGRADIDEVSRGEIMTAPRIFSEEVFILERVEKP